MVVKRIGILLILCVNILSVCSINNDILYNLAKIGSENEKISVECHNNLGQILNSINAREIWAMKLLDASGKFGSGFTWGNNYLLGDQGGCRMVNSPISISQTRRLNPLNSPNLITERSPFPVEYRMVYIRHTSQLQFDIGMYDRKILHIGLCFPQSCRDADTMELAQNYFYKHEYVGHEFTGSNITVLRTKILELRPDFWNDPFVKLLTWITLFNVLNVAIGTIYTSNAKQNRLKSMKKTDNNDKPIKPSLLKRWFSSFSLIENTKWIFSLSVGDGSIKIVHGVRALGMCWLVIGHVTFFSVKFTDNWESNLKYTEIWYLQPFTTNFLGVDTFIVLGAFLLSVLYFERLKTVKKENGVGLVVKAFFFRYIKLTPLYFVVILLAYTFTIFLEDTTPFSMIENYEKNCNERLWLNLLYINNLFPLKDNCLLWSWYLANDFQSFIIALAVLVVFTRNKKLGIWLGTGISLISMSVCMYFAVTLKFSFAFDNYFNDMMYFSTWNRLAAYFVALVAGWYFSKENCQLRLSKFYIVLYWIIAEIILFGIIFLHAYKEYNPILAVLYSGFGRTLWSIATCWILMACASNNGGLLTKILESKMLIPLSRMSFACYLINPILISSIFMLSETAYHMNLLLYIIDSFGLVAICIVASYIIIVVYESPFNNLIRTFIEKK